MQDQINAKYAANAEQPGNTVSLPSSGKACFAQYLKNVIYKISLDVAG